MTANASRNPDPALEETSQPGLGKMRVWWSGVQPSALVSAQQKVLKDTPASNAHSQLFGSPGARLNTVDLPGPVGSEEHPPLVLLHGFGTGLGIWARQLKDLTEDSRVIAVDLPGMGGSERAPFHGQTEEEAEEYFLEAIEMWRQDMGLGQMVLVGHGLGGYLAAAFALKYPQYIAHLVLVSPQGLTSIDAAHDASATPAMAVLWSRGITPQCLCRWGGRLLGPGVVSRYVDSRFEGEPTFWRQALSQYLYAAWASPSDAELAVTRLLQLTGQPAHPLQERLRKLKVGVVFVYGHYDWSEHKAADELIPRLSVSGSVALLANAGHYPFVDNAPKFNALLQRLMFVTRARKDGFQVGLHPLEPTPPGSGNASARSMVSNNKSLAEEEGAAGSQAESLAGASEQAHVRARGLGEHVGVHEGVHEGEGVGPQHVGQQVGELYLL
mmetsp:Transcript_50919/g.119722  ORF Transcript_50919/g.119722 Transcript_50919/m.119722 type:complete len:441 (+) Transcript_50919:102-1424(+)